MTTTQARFAEMQPTAPDSEQLARSYQELVERASDCATDAARSEFIASWERTRRKAVTWASLARLRFQQDTRDSDAKSNREAADALMIEITELDARVKRLLLEEPGRAEWERLLGSQAIALWRADLGAFEPTIKAGLVAEEGLCAEYVSLVGSAEFEFEGQSLSLSELSRNFMHADRDLRHAAESARWRWFADNREQLDNLFDQLVRGRDEMARSLGYDNFVALGYERKRRVDYDKHDVERFREQIVQKLVPLCSEIAARQAKDLGLNSLRYWDEKQFGPGESPAPLGGHDWMLDRGREMFQSMSSKISGFYDMMIECDLTDLESRKGKAVGGFCTYFHDYRVPFIFANFNGTRGDVRVFTHEMGHAFQRWSSSGQPLSDYVGCTSESAEIHSMSLEFLAWPEMNRFFGDSAEEFCRVHLLEQLLFLPYGVAIDHFQHEVYENPQASPAERFAMWQRLEKLYMPWRNYGDLPHVSDGGFWQLQRHVYIYPFYYIDYTLAATCALQFWARSREDYSEAMRDYVALCARGGSLPFRQLTQSAGLVSPFDAGCLDQVVETARAFLEI